MRTAKFLVAALVLGVGGCQCLQPVGEGNPDGGGADAGSNLDAGSSPDAGVDAGAPSDGGNPVQCTTAAQCIGARPAQSLCSFGPDAGFSCIDRRCVFECSPDRTCLFDAGTSCLDCVTPTATSCLNLGCGAATMQGQVESMTASCQLGFSDVMLQPLGGCQWAVTDTTGPKGVMTQVGGGQYVGQFTGLGTCVGMSLFTQVERVLFSCEGCQFVLRI